MGSMDAYFHQAVVRNKIENELYRRYNVKKGYATKMAPVYASV
ncbi:MAG: hypothetical protein ACLVJ6_07585 [Merdibacter sp.]